MWTMAAKGLMGVALCAAGIAAAAGPDLHKRVGGIDVYYGLVPAQLAAQRSHGEGGMESVAPKGKDSYHLLVTLKDAASGKPIEGARVAATVGELGLAGKRKTLEPMRIADTVTYGNYFVMKGAGPYRILVSVTTPGAAKPIEASFDHKLR